MVRRLITSRRCTVEALLILHAFALPLPVTAQPNRHHKRDVAEYCILRIFGVCKFFDPSCYIQSFMSTKFLGHSPTS